MSAVAQEDDWPNLCAELADIDVIEIYANAEYTLKSYGPALLSLAIIASSLVVGLVFGCIFRS